MSKLWKSAERKIAKLLGGERVPITGRQRGSSPDILHPSLSVEVKQRHALPGWLLDGMDQAKKSSTDGKIPVVFLHQTGLRYEEALTVMELSDMMSLLRKAEALDALTKNSHTEVRHDRAETAL